MKAFLRTSVFAAVAALMVSCGDGLDAGTCIDSAEELIELKESPLLGELPSLSDQCIEASRAARDKAHQLFENETDGDNRNELLDRKEEVLREIKEYFYPKMTEIAEGLSGKEIPVKFDDAVFKSAKVTITKVKVSGDCYFDVKLDTKLETVAEPDGSPYAYVAQLLDSNGNVVVVVNWLGENVECSTPFGLSQDGRLLDRFSDYVKDLFLDQAYHDGATIYFGSGR